MSDTFFELNSEGHVQEIDIHTGKVVRKEQSISDLMLPGASLEMCNTRLKYRYSVTWGKLICQHLLDGKMTLRDICQLPGYPSIGVVSKWRIEHAELDDAIEMARKMRGERYEDMIHDMAVNEKVIDKEHVPGIKARFDMLKWLASVSNKEKYSPSQSSGKGEGGVTIILDTGIKRNEDIIVDEIEYKEVSDEKQSVD